jgi:hypothetical protein
MPMGTEEEGVDVEEEEGVAVAVFKLGAGGPLTDKSIPQTQMDEVPGVASREVGGGGRVLILGNMLYLLPYPRAPPPPHVHRCHHCHRPQALLPLLPLPRVPALPLPRSLAIPLPPAPLPIPPPFPRAPLPRLVPSSWAYPRFLLPGVGRHQIILLMLKQDISTAASTIASAAGATSMGTASATVECDSLSRRAQMIILMDSRNAYVLLSRRAVCLFTMPHLLVYMLCLR